VALAGMIGSPPAAVRPVPPAAQPVPVAAPVRREAATTTRTSGVEVIRAGKRDIE
jgi:pilus assembly protein CpaB